MHRHLLVAVPAGRPRCRWEEGLLRRLLLAWRRRPGASPDDPTAHGLHGILNNGSDVKSSVEKMASEAIDAFGAGF